MKKLSDPDRNEFQIGKSSYNFTESQVLDSGPEETSRVDSIAVYCSLLHILMAESWVLRIKLDNKMFLVVCIIIFR